MSSPGVYLTSMIDLAPNGRTIRRRWLHGSDLRKEAQHPLYFASSLTRPRVPSRNPKCSVLKKEDMTQPSWPNMVQDAPFTGSTLNISLTNEETNAAQPRPQLERSSFAPIPSRQAFGPFVYEASFEHRITMCLFAIFPQ
jgi:hypothetical protein